MNTAHKIKHAFGNAAPTYDDHCHLQLATANKLLALIPRKSFQHGIDLGCGTGINTLKLAETFSLQRLHAIDIAPALLAKARARLSRQTVVYEADFDHLPEHENSFDLIFSNMALQWSQQLLETLSKLNRQLTSDGLFAFSLPLKNTLHELNDQFALREFYSENEMRVILQKAGFSILHEEVEIKEYQFSDTYSALRSLKKIGATVAAKKSGNHLAGKTNFNSCDIKKLTYVIGYYVCRI